MQAGAVALGFDDRVEMVRSTRGWNPDELAAVTRGALNDSETGYYAAMRRLLARAGIEQGDGSLADAWFGLRGTGWDAWFEPRRFLRIMEGTVAGLGMDLAIRAGVTIDVESRPTTAQGAFFVPVLPARGNPHSPPALTPPLEGGVFCMSPRKGIFQALLGHGRRCDGRPAKALGLLGQLDPQALSC